MQPLILSRGIAGVPGTTVVADLSDRSPSVDFSHAALWGCRDARIGWNGSFDDGFLAADAWLGAPVEIWAPDATWCWEGLVWSVAFGAGRRRRTRSLDGYANRVRVHWVEKDATSGVLAGPAVPIVANDVTGQSLYGVIEYQYNAGSITAASATALAAEQLSRRSRLLYLPESGSLSNDPGAIELGGVGWYRTLGYQAYVSTATSTATIDTAIKAMLAVKAPQLSSDHSQITAVAETTSQTFDLYETPLEIVKRLMAQASGYVFGIGRGRVPYLQPSKRLNATAAYIEHLDGLIEDTSSGAVPPWAVRPNNILRQVNFAPTSRPVAAIDAIESVYLNSTTYRSGDASPSYQVALPGVLGEIEL